MTRPILELNVELDLMVQYTTIIKSRSVIVQNAPNDPDRYTLYEICEPYPSYEEYMNGNEFDEGLLIRNSPSLNLLKLVQSKRVQVIA